MGKRVLIALGGNAIKQPDEWGAAEEQMRNVSVACRQIAEIARRGYEVAITHGNGPQVGNLSIQQEQARHLVPPQPLVILGAMTQGQIGYMIQQSLRNQLAGDGRQVVTIITQVVVDRDDPDFEDPHKPIGPFYTEEEAERLGAEKGWTFRMVRPSSDRPWRRVVPSPEPLGIVEGEGIKRMIDAGMIVIASGGGGVPVVVDGSGRLEGVDAVVDKDLAGAVLAEEVDADILLILTDVDGVKLDYGRPTERAITHVTADRARAYMREGHFPPGSMGPKVEACIRFVEGGGEGAVIASLEGAIEALEGRAGTLITRG
ncbi:MAG: carbamate kinase [Candidatus Bathyarchaeia archaeon]